MAAQASLDMGQGSSGRNGAERSAQSARSVALDHHKVGARAGAERRPEGGGDEIGMVPRVRAGLAAKPEQADPGEAVGGGVEAGVLAGQGETHTVPTFQQGVSQGRELDGFGTGPDDEQ
jgi:hypothetical protein